MRDYEDVLKQAKTCANRKYCSIGGNCEYYDLDVCCEDSEKDILKDAADAIEELLAFAKFVARQAIDTGDNDGVSAEILCRKLNKLGLIETDGEFWMLPTPPKGVE